jgi:hypothetical protein
MTEEKEQGLEREIGPQTLVPPKHSTASSCEAAIIHQRNQRCLSEH